MIGTAFLLAAAVAFEQPHVVPTPAKADWQLDQCVELKPELRVSMSAVDSRQRRHIFVKSCFFEKLGFLIMAEWRRETVTSR